MTFYTYIDWTLETIPRVFYVGKGRVGRLTNFRRNWSHRVTRKRLGCLREIVLQTSLEDIALKHEIDLIAKYHTFIGDPDYNEVGCNYTLGGDGLSGHKHSIDARLKMRTRALTRKPHSFETLQRISTSKKGWKPSDETRQRMSISHQGMKFSDEHRQNLSNSKLGRKLGTPSLQHKQRISQALTGLIRQPFSDEHRKKLSEATKQSWKKRREKT